MSAQRKAGRAPERRRAPREWRRTATARRSVLVDEKLEQERNPLCYLLRTMKYGGTHWVAVLVLLACNSAGDVGGGGSDTGASSGSSSSDGSDAGATGGSTETSDSSASSGTPGSSTTSTNPPWEGCPDQWTADWLANVEDAPDPDTDLEWAEIPAGTFMMGSPDDEIGRPGGPETEALHEVTLTRPFRVLTTEVWNELYCQFVPDYCETDVNMEYMDHPASSLTWHEAAAFTNMLSCVAEVQPCYTCAETGGEVDCVEADAWPTVYECPGFRLATDAEWEYSYRAGTTTAYYNGPNLPVGDGEPDPNLDPIACYGGGGWCPVGSKEPNAWGLYDMAGNATEWVNDFYEGDLGSQAVTDPTGPSSGEERVLRNCDWRLESTSCRAATRQGRPPDLVTLAQGIRPVQTSE